MQALFNSMGQSRLAGPGQTGKPEIDATMTVKSLTPRSGYCGIMPDYIVHDFPSGMLEGWSA